MAIRTDTGHCFISDNDSTGNEDLMRDPNTNDFYLECAGGIVTLKTIVVKVSSGRSGNSVVPLIDTQTNLLTLSRISTVECGYYDGPRSCP